MDIKYLQIAVMINQTSTCHNNILFMMFKGEVILNNICTYTEIIKFEFMI